MTTHNIESFGAIGDGKFDNSGPFSKAMQTIKEAGGGTLKIGKGIWLTGPMEIFSNTILILEEEAVISFIPEPERYRPVRTRWEGVECYAMHPCVFSDNQENITIKGKGTFDGNGKWWWDLYRKKKSIPQAKPESPEEIELANLNTGYDTHPSGGGGRGIQFLRPPLIQFRNCTYIKMEGITVCNSPFWTIHPLYCSKMLISDVKVINPKDAPNTDGIDIDSCEDVLIEYCHVAVGDDGIAIKSGAGEDGILVGKPCRRITIKNCIVEDGHGGVVIGSETAAGIFNVTAEDCLFRGTDRGIRIKTRRSRGGDIRDLEFKNLKMENNLCPVAINMFYRCGAVLSDGYFSQEALPINNATPSIKNINIVNMKATGCRASAGFIVGLPESPIENISFNQCELTTNEQSGINPDESEMFLGLPPVSEKSIRILYTKNAEFNETYVHGPKQAFIYK